jgi:hypothetical protein
MVIDGDRAVGAEVAHAGGGKNSTPHAGIERKVDVARRITDARGVDAHVTGDVQVG